MNRWLTHSEFNDLYGSLNHREPSAWQIEFMGVFEESPKAVFVVAYSLYMAQIWAHSVGHSISKRDFTYVDNADKLRGRKDLIIVFLRGWDRRSDAYDIARTCESVKLLGRAQFRDEQNFQEEPQNSEDISGQRQETPESQ